MGRGKFAKRRQVKSYKQIEREYKAMVLKNDGLLTYAINNYKCPNCRFYTKTINLNVGVTPFVFTCHNCGSAASSTGFEDFIPDHEPHYEWYRPSLKETQKLRNKPELLNHILHGGLNYRPYNKKEESHDNH